jgi:hypothetical protein
MSVAQRAVAVVALTVALCPRAYAPIFGGYPGLRALIQQSEIIAAATVLERLPGTGDIGGSDEYKIEFTKVLKGSPPQKQATVWLRQREITSWVEPLPSPLPSRIYHFRPTEMGLFRPGDRYVLFLVKSERRDNSSYENTNCEGSSFPISPLRDLASLKVESLPDTLILLFREYVDFKRRELTELEHQLNAFIHEGDK